MFLNMLKVIKEMGVNWFLFRSFYELKKRSGILKRKFPAREWQDINILDVTGFESEAELLDNWDQHSSFLFNQQELLEIKKYLQDLSSEDQEKIIAVADQALEGKILAFSSWYADYSNPINWHLNPVTGQQAPADKHWLEIEELGDKFGDVKYIWEASRFPQVYYFARAYLITGDSKYVEGFWRQLENWLENNPPELGVNWKCGQEITFRTFAWIFGLYVFKENDVANPERIIKLLKAVYYNIRHVEKNFEFALKAVKNNHAISEAAGMFVTGTLFPFLKHAQKWQKKGKKHLVEQGLRQIYEDGSYMQYSFNYHRLVFQIYSFVLCLADRNNISFSRDLKDRLLKAVNFLYQFQDEKSGRVPNYGNNDGSLIFLLSSADYLDYRPQLNSLHYLLTDNKLYNNSSIFNEELVWFCGSDALNAALSEKRRVNSAFPEGGYYSLQNEQSHLLFRCGTFRDRPSQADMLHLDLWWKDHNILADPGSFSYNPAEEKIVDYFQSTVNHNTISVNGREQMNKGPRFLWLDWTEAELTDFAEEESYNYLQGQHYGFDELIHRRGIFNHKDLYLVIDEILKDPEGDQSSYSENSLDITQNWLSSCQRVDIKENNLRFDILLADGKDRYTCRCLTEDVEVKSYQGSKEPVAGWLSYYYGNKEPAPQIKLIKRSTELPERIVTLFYPNNYNITCDYNDNRINMFVDGVSWQIEFTNAGVNKKMVKIH